MTNNNTSKSPLGDRMKAYESTSKQFLTRRMPYIIRLDGKAFHSYTMGMEPFDKRIVENLNYACSVLLKQIDGAKLAYLQSDEISILVTDYSSLDSEPWFGKNVQKICSISASIFSVEFNTSRINDYKNAYFDSRVFVLPKEEVCNYFIWRQQDAIRNSILNMSQTMFSHKELQGINCSVLKEKMISEKNFDWNSMETWKQRGWCVDKVLDPVLERSKFVENFEIPLFAENREFVERHV